MVKEQPASNRLLDLVAWFDVHARQVIIGAAIAIVLIVAAVVILYRQSRKEVRASEALSEVRPLQSTNPVPPDGTADLYLKVAEAHSGTKAAARAVLEAAGTYFVQGRYAEAQRQFERVAREFPESPWQAEAAMGIAASMEGQGKSQEAITKYEELRKRYANSTVVDPAKLHLARLYEIQDKPGEAFKLYEELTRMAQMNPYSAVGNEAGLRMEELVKKHPELVKTNPPPPAMSITPQMQPGQTGAMQTITLTNFGTPTTGAAPRVITLTNLVTPPPTGTPATSAPPAATPQPPPAAIPNPAPAPAPGTPPGTSK